MCTSQCHELATGYCGRCDRGVVWVRRLRASWQPWSWLESFKLAAAPAWECSECGEMALRPSPSGEPWERVADRGRAGWREGYAPRREAVRHSTGADQQELEAHRMP
jgi:hypothetical protein